MPTITVFPWTPDSVGGKLGWDAVWSLNLHFPTRGTQQETVNFSHILTSGNIGAAQTEHAGDRLAVNSPDYYLSYSHAHATKH